MATTRQWWDVPVGQSHPEIENFSDADAVAQFRGKLEDPVRTRLMADVPLGMFLSGGLDSSAIAALMAGMIDRPLETFYRAAGARAMSGSANRRGGDDPVPGTAKVDIAQRLIKAIDPSIRVDKVQDSLVSDAGFAAIKSADYVIAGLDSEGARLVLNELCAAYQRPYWDLASDVIPGAVPEYGGRICVNTWGEIKGCLMCRGLIDVEEAQLDLGGPAARRDRDAIYGVQKSELSRSGPSVVTINGVVASLAATELMVAVTGLRRPLPVIMYRGHTGRLTTAIDPPAPDCFYCEAVRGQGDAADVQRYIRNGIGRFLR